MKCFLQALRSTGKFFFFFLFFTGGGGGSGVGGGLYYTVTVGNCFGTEICKLTAAKQQRKQNRNDSMTQEETLNIIRIFIWLSK